MDAGDFRVGQQQETELIEENHEVFLKDRHLSKYTGCGNSYSLRGMFCKVLSKGRNAAATAYGDMFADSFWRSKPRNRSDSPLSSRSRDLGMWSRGSS